MWEAGVASHSFVPSFACNSMFVLAMLGIALALVQPVCMHPFYSQLSTPTLSQEERKGNVLRTERTPVSLVWRAHALSTSSAHGHSLLWPSSSIPHRLNIPIHCIQAPLSLNRPAGPPIFLPSLHLIAHRRGKGQLTTAAGVLPWCGNEVLDILAGELRELCVGRESYWRW